MVSWSVIGVSMTGTGGVLRLWKSIWFGIIGGCMVV